METESRGSTGMGGVGAGTTIGDTTAAVSPPQDCDPLVLGDLDCINDNTYTTQRQQQQQTSPNQLVTNQGNEVHQMSPTTNMAPVQQQQQQQHSIPLRSSSQSSLISDQPCHHHHQLHQHPASSIGGPGSGGPSPTMAGLLYSPEDTLNNDFFYDDEFTVPFDANLGQMEAGDLNLLLNLSEMNQHNNAKWDLPRMVTSKSDSCLYHADLELSDSEPNMSGSERDFFSSGEMSDFKNELLFTPPPDEAEQLKQCAPTVTPEDSLVREEGGLGDSHTKGMSRYQYDWSANKDQYMISFDRSPNKCSTEDSYHEHGRAAPDVQTTSAHGGTLTSWVQKSQGSWGSDGSRRNTVLCYSASGSGSGSGSSGAFVSSGCGSGCGTGSGSPASGSGAFPSPLLRKTHTFETPSPPRHSSALFSSSSSQKHSTSSASSSDTSTSSTLTTWKQLRKRQKGKVTDIPEGMTTWQKLREAQSKAKMDTSWFRRCKSMSDLQSQLDADDKSALERVEDDEAGCKPEASEPAAAATDDPKSKRYSTSLLELYRRMKTQCDDALGLGHEAMVSPNSLQFLMETWNMSPASSHRSNTTLHLESPCPAPALPQDALLAAKPGHNGIVSWNTVKNLNHAADFIEPNRDVIVDSDELINALLSKNAHATVSSTGVQAGSFIGLQTSHPHMQNIAVQFPPKLSDCGMQTSMLRSFSDGHKKQVNKSLQTSISLMDFGVHRAPVLSRARSATSDMVVKLSSQAKERMSRSLYFMGSALPDLSFLKTTGMSQSTTTMPACTHMGTNPAHQNLKHPAHQNLKHPAHQNLKNAEVKQLGKQPRMGYRPKKPPRQASPGSRSVPREGTTTLVAHPPRRRSRSSDSCCSTSSSGIDIGSYDLQQMNRTAQYIASVDSGHYSSHHSLDEDRSTDSDNPRLVSLAKPLPRVLAGRIHGIRPDVIAKPGQIPVVYAGVCRCCRDKMVCIPEKSKEDRGPVMYPQLFKMATSHPGYDSGSMCQDEAGSEVEKMKCPGKPNQGEHKDVVGRCSTHEGRSEHQALGRKQQSRRPLVECDLEVFGQYSQLDASDKPLKSCLANKQKDRKYMGMKHRSWSDPSDGSVRYCPRVGGFDPSSHTRDCAIRQLVTPAPGSNTPSLPPPSTKVETVKDEISTPQSTGLVEHVVTAPCENPNLCASTDEHEHNEANKENVPQNISPIECASPKTTVTPPNSPEDRNTEPCKCKVAKNAPCSVPKPDVMTTAKDAVAPPMGIDLSDRELLMGSGFNDISRTKKSVSFSEEISYHSPYSSPHQSPHKHVRLLGCGGEEMRGTVVMRQQGPRKKRPVSLPPGLPSFMLEPSTKGCRLAAEGPPMDFMVSPTRTSPPPFAHSDSMVDMAQKKDLVLEVMRSAECILQHFCQTRDMAQKVCLGNTSLCPDIGNLVLQHLCPTVYAVMLDGLKPAVRSLFGKVKNNVWKVIEDDMEHGPCSRIIVDLVKDLKNLDFLSTPWLKFNAFIFGLLNNKALDFWLMHIHNNQDLLGRHYTTSSFLHLSSSASTKHLFLDLTTALQPLAQMPFRLEYNFEYVILREKRQQQLADHMLDKHVAQSQATHIEGQQLLHQLENMQCHLGSGAEAVVLSPGSELTRQTKEVLKTTGKQIADKLNQKTELLSKLQQNKDLLVSGSKQAWQSVVPWGYGMIQIAADFAAGGKNLRANKAILPQSVPQLKGINDSCDSAADGGNEAGTGKPLAARQEVPIVKDNAMLEGDMDASDVDARTTDKQTVLARLTKQVTGMSPPQHRAVYKKGVTEYAFEPIVDKGITKESTSVDKPTPSNRASIPGSLLPRESLFDENGMPKSPPEEPPVVFMIPSRDGEKKSPVTGPQTEVEFGGHQPASIELTQKVGSALKKRWSSFGPTLINVFDKLLLASPKKGQGQGQGQVIARSQSESEVKSQCLPAEPSSWNTASLRRRKAMESRAVSVDSGTAKAAQEGTAGLVTEPTITLPEGSPPEGPTASSVRTLCHYVATEEEHLSFDKGTVMQVIDQVEADWLLCCHGDKQGLVHRACIKSC